MTSFSKACACRFGQIERDWHWSPVLDNTGKEMGWRACNIVEEPSKGSCHPRSMTPVTFQGQLRSLTMGVPAHKFLLFQRILPHKTHPGDSNMH